MIIEITAFVIDILIGDPRSKFHPVVLMGNLISLLEKILYNANNSNRIKLLKGALLVLIVIFVNYFIGFAIDNYALRIPHYELIEALVLSFMISPRSLSEAGKELYNFLIIAQ